MSVLIPAYNEAAIIERTLGTVRDHLSTRSDAYSWEMLVVDDGSTDGTGDLAEAFATGDERIRVLRHRTNFGLGQALRYGFAQAKGDVVVTLDADLTYSVDHIDRLLDAFEETGAKIVVASPYAHGGVTTRVPFRRLLPSRVANVLLAAASNAHISTYTGMVRAYDTRFLRSLNVRAMGMDVNAEILRQAQILRARIVEIPAHLDWSANARSRGRFGPARPAHHGRDRDLRVPLPARVVLHGSGARCSPCSRSSRGASPSPPASAAFVSSRRSRSSRRSPPSSSPASRSSRFRRSAASRTCSSSVPPRIVRSRKDPHRDHHRRRNRTDDAAVGPRRLGPHARGRRARAARANHRLGHAQQHQGHDGRRVRARAGAHDRRQARDRVRVGIGRRALRDRRAEPGARRRDRHDRDHRHGRARADPVPRRDPGVRGRRPAHVQRHGGDGRGAHHAAHARDRRDAPVRQPVRHAGAARARGRARRSC